MPSVASMIDRDAGPGLIRADWVSLDRSALGRAGSGLEVGASQMGGR